ncbi:hypothetical protein DW757_04580 [Clostridium sp. AM29-11AC]|nr:hypothetical protein DW757_04580 [Clostridium sp. AM29-11AC]
MHKMPCQKRRISGRAFHNRKLRSLLYKNASRGSHWVGKENAASATRRRRRILLRTRTQGRCCLKATALGASVRLGAHFFISELRGGQFPPARGLPVLSYGR